MKQVAMILFMLFHFPVQAAVECINESIAVGEATPNTDFVDNADGTVTHSPTGLQWMRCSLGQSWDSGSIACAGSGLTYAWLGASQAVRRINNGNSNADGDNAPGFAGYSDWRLPNIKELESIVETRCWNPSINTAQFPNTAADYFWSSSPGVNEPYVAWAISAEGRMVTIFKSAASYVRLVRGE